MKIVKRSNASTIEEVIEQNTGMTLNEFLEVEDKSYNISGIEQFQEIVKAHKKISVFGDYDVDGVTSTYIMVCLLKGLKKDVHYRFPRRLTEGFGLSKAAIDSAVENGSTLIITVDNGITQNEAVAYAKEKGLTVIVTDHHLANEELPDADLIINPTALPDTADFNEYCGAGIAYKIACSLVSVKKFQEQCCVIAAIGTIADSVRLVGDNRKIVAEGLELIRKGKENCGVRMLIEGMGIDAEHITADNIAYKIAPALNAPGRLFDDGADIAFKMLCSTADNGENNAKEIIELNNQRQALVDDAVSRINETVAKQGIKCPLIIEEELHEGIIGIVAGKLAEKYRIPAFVLTKTEEGYKGSARAPKGFNLKEMLDSYSDLLVRYGGHAAAAGLTVKEECLSDFITLLQGDYASYEVPEQVIYYDLKVDEEDLPFFAKRLEQFGPFGAGNPTPVVLVEGLTLVPDRDGKLVKVIGEKQNTLRFSAMNKMSALTFGDVERYDELGRPDTITAVGTVNTNYWNGWSFVQIILQAYDKAPDSYLSLAGLVKAKLRALRGTVNPAGETSDPADNDEK